MLFSLVFQIATLLFKLKLRIFLSLVVHLLYIQMISFYGFYSKNLAPDNIIVSSLLISGTFYEEILLAN